MCLIIIASGSWRPEAAIDKTLGILSPIVVLYLLPNKGVQVKVSWKLVSFCPRVANPALCIERLGNSHYRLTVHAQKTAALHLELDSGQRKWSPFGSGILLYLGDLCILCVEALLEDDGSNGMIKQVYPSPKKVHGDVIAHMFDLDGPKRLWLEIPNSPVSVNHEP